MRISDWSSDVCSSDLDVISGRSLRDGDYEASSGTFGAAVVNRLTSYNSQDVQYDLDTLAVGYDIGSGVIRVTPRIAPAMNSIGRASVRERVGQYVEITGVAGC